MSFISPPKMLAIHVLLSKEDINQLCFPFNFYLPRLSAKQLSKECHPDPQPPREPRCLLTPPPTAALTPASCSLGLVVVVSVLVELCDVGGKRDGVGAAVRNAVPPEGGMG